MSLHALTSKFKSVGSGSPDLSARAFDQSVDDAMLDCKSWNNAAAAATTAAISERVGAMPRRKCRLVGAWLVPSAAVSGTATNFFTLIIRKRTAALPGTQVALITFAADTTTTDDIAAFARKDLYVSTYLDAVASTDLDFAAGDVATVEVTKAGSGMTFPVADVLLHFAPRD